MTRLTVAWRLDSWRSTGISALAFLAERGTLMQTRDRDAVVLTGALEPRRDGCAERSSGRRGSARFAV